MCVDRANPTRVANGLDPISLSGAYDADETLGPAVTNKRYRGIRHGAGAEPVEVYVDGVLVGVLRHVV
jgi:hypothetical protein